ncbi:MAG: DNA recombination protein RmuC [Porphyromonadaceae bacterium]|jgi:DNA recombination protein RmuC|nr:DNA recombination protein RmuC [Porphyromonadaceae bacterium]
MDNLTIILLLLLVLLLGFIVAWFYQSGKINRIKNEHTDELQLIQNKLNESVKQYSITNENLTNKITDYQILKQEFEETNRNFIDLGKEFAGLEIANANLREKLQNQKVEIEEMQKRLTTEFENIASKILKERADDFSESNQKNITQILNPLKEKISSFEKRVEEAYDKELRDKISLKAEIETLTKLNTQVSDDAKNLTQALKGDVKKQGNWGEVILERVLERSGLTKGQEYTTQEEVKSYSEQRQRPDVIVHLPDDKHIIIDSKVSLLAYEQYISAENQEDQLNFLRKHIQSLRLHVKSLNEKNYQQAVNINTPDFVLMFLPIEASFSVAVQNDSDLYAYAWERKVVIVSPTTLLATLKTVSSIWKQENQTKNAQEIARLSKAMYDKFVAFAEDMDRIKTNLDKASGAYNEALKKMKDGRGNILRTAERIQELAGIDSQKTLPTDFQNF